jgi:ethanolamine kinase
MATSDNIIAQIAKKLAQLHSTPGADAVFGPSSQATKTPFAKTREWLAIAEKLDFTTTSSITDAEIAKKKAEKLATFDFKEMNRQVDLVEAIATTKLNSPIVLAHCDLLAGNIMYNQPPSNGSNDNINGNNIVGAAINLLGSSGGNNCSNDNINGSSKDDAEVMTFIDFEYSGWAPRGFDFGNHFCEYAGFDCDYSRYPDERAASKFLKTYLEETKAMMMMGQSGNNNKNNKNGIEVVTVGDDEVRAAVREANVYALSSHMFWGAWAFLQAAWSDIDFDYLEYAGLRWGEYYKRRDEFLGAVGE